LFDILRFKRETRQNSEVRDQMSEVRENLIYDLRFLTSVMDGFNGLSNRQRTTYYGQSRRKIAPYKGKLGGQKNLLVKGQIVLRLDDPDKPRAGTWLQETNL